MPTLQELYEARRLGRALVVPQDLAPVAGIVSTMQFNPATHGVYDISNVADTLPIGSFRYINGGRVVSTSSRRGVKIELYPFGTIYEIDEYLIEGHPGGLPGFVKDKILEYSHGLTKSFESTMIYGDTKGFTGLREIAKDNSKMTPVNAAGTGEVYTSIIAVKWDPALCTGLYNKKQFKEGLFVPVILNNGKSIQVPVFESGLATGEKKPVFQFAIEQPFGLKVIGGTQVAVLSGIKDADNYRPTTTLMDTLLNSINADPGNTKLYMRRNCRTFIKDLKNSKLSIDDNSGNIFQSPSAYDTIPLIITSELTQTEANAA